MLAFTPTRRALAALALGGFGIGTGEFVMLGLLPNVASSLHVSIPSGGHLISAYALGVVVGAPLLTALTARWPRKGLLIALALAMALGNLLTAAVPGFPAALLLRFATGLPHGAYFGVAAVAAGAMVVPERRNQAMAAVFAGLTTANIVGVPITTFIGQQAGWRSVFALVGAIQIVTAVLIWRLLPRIARPAAPESALRRELAAFRQPAVWLGLAVATVGGGAMFAIFSYITPMMTHVAGFAESSVVWLMMLFGVGMTVGSLLGARMSDRRVQPTLYVALSAEIAFALIFLFAAHNRWAAAAMILIFPLASGALFPPIQARIVVAAGGAPNLAAASIHSAFNVANSIGAWLGGLTIAAGWGYGSPNLVAAGLAAVGLAIAVYAGFYDRRSPAAEPDPANSGVLAVPEAVNTPGFAG